MKIKFCCPRWGAEHIPWDSFCAMVKGAGFDGVETPIPFEQREKKAMATALQKHGLLLIGQYHQSFEKEMAAHKKSFKAHLENIAALNPILIVAQTGKDYYTSDQNRELFELAAAVTKTTGIVIAHETHRNKALFAAHVASQLLAENRDVLITADFSHWCNVSESLLEQQEAAVDLAVSRAVHIHARVGHAESAQVSDPRAPEWRAEVAAHHNWWDRIVAERLMCNADLLTITPEFGPAPYMPAIPFTRVPVASQWDVNVYMLGVLRERYGLYL